MSSSMILLSSINLNSRLQDTIKQHTINLSIPFFQIAIIDAFTYSKQLF